MEMIAWLLITCSIVGWVVLYTYNWRNRNKNICTSHVLDKVAQTLVGQMLNNQTTLNMAIQREQHMQQTIEFNQDVIIKNNDLLKRINVDLYHVKESTVWLYDHYKSLLREIDINIGEGHVDMYNIQPTRMQVSDGIQLIDSYFYQTFKMSIDDYRKQKANISGTNGNTNFLGMASIN